MDANQIIDDLGGTAAVADIFKVTTGAVSQWRMSGIPEARLMYLRLLRPDIVPAVAAANDAGPEAA